MDDPQTPLLSNIDHDNLLDLPPLPGSSFGSADFQVGADVRFIDLKDVYEKSQSRSGGVAKQRVDDGLVHMEAQSPVGQILDIKVWVLREPQAAELHRDKNGPVELPVKHGEHDIEKHCFSVNLDSIYDGPVAPVYELAKVEMNKRNLFQLSVELSFHNGLEMETQRFLSKIFRMKSKPRQTGAKRPRSGDAEDQQESEEVPGWSSSPDSNVSIGSADFQHLRVFDHLEAKRAHIEHLSFVTSFPKNTHADIGYHFKLKDPDVCNEFDEGDVVGFFKDDNGTTSIKLLDNKNGKEAFMAGVISRSTYLEAKPRPEDDDLTDVVCVIGVVSVKCVGSVRAGERVYATIDPDSPGTALPESHLPPSVMLSKTSLLLGMSLEEKKASKLDDTHLVQCFVCIVLGVSDHQVSMEIENLYKKFEMDVGVRLRKERKRFYKMLCRVMTALVVVLCLVGVLLYQVFVPGSAFRYWICKRGSIEGHTCTFRFIPYGDITQRFWVHGVEFEWEKLARQMGDVPPMNSTVVPGTHHYFFNIDRCAYGGIRLSSSAKGKQVGGAIVFAVNHNCTAVYYYQDAPYPGWKKYKSVARYFQDDLKCRPKDAFR